MKLRYNIKRGSKVIGSMTVNQNTSATNVKTVKLESHIKTSFVVAIAVDAKEESVFQDGVLTYSSVYRKVNGTEKVNKKHRSYGNGYAIEYKGKTDSLCCIQIQYNLMTMYAIEPVNIMRVYSDNYQKFLVIQKLGAHVYKIEVPDGSYNVYHYLNGRCIKIEIHQTLYTAVMELT